MTTNQSEQMPEEMWIFKYKHHGIYDSFAVFQSEPGDKTNSKKYIRADLHQAFVDELNKQYQVISDQQTEIQALKADLVEKVKA